MIYNCSTVRGLGQCKEPASVNPNKARNPDLGDIRRAALLCALLFLGAGCATSVEKPPPLRGQGESTTPPLSISAKAVLNPANEPNTTNAGTRTLVLEFQLGETRDEALSTDPVGSTAPELPRVRYLNASAQREDSASAPILDYKNQDVPKSIAAPPTALPARRVASELSSSQKSSSQSEDTSMDVLAFVGAVAAGVVVVALFRRV